MMHEEIALAVIATIRRSKGNRSNSIEVKLDFPSIDRRSDAEKALAEISAIIRGLPHDDNGGAKSDFEFRCSTACQCELPSGRTSGGAPGLCCICPGVFPLSL